MERYRDAKLRAVPRHLGAGRRRGGERRRPERRERFVAAARERRRARAARLARRARRGRRALLERAEVALDGTRARARAAGGRARARAPAGRRLQPRERAASRSASRSALGVAPAGDRARRRGLPAGARPRSSASERGRRTRRPCSSTTRTRPTRSRSCSRTLRPLAAGRLIAVFGCGGDRDRGKRPLMARGGGAPRATASSRRATTRAPRTRSAILDDVERGLAGLARVAARRARRAPQSYARIADRRAAIERAIAHRAPRRHRRDRRQGPRGLPDHRAASGCRSTTARRRGARCAARRRRAMTEPFSADDAVALDRRRAAQRRARSGASPASRPTPAASRRGELFVAIRGARHDAPRLPRPRCCRAGAAGCLVARAAATRRRAAGLP